MKSDVDKVFDRINPLQWVGLREDNITTCVSSCPISYHITSYLSFVFNVYYSFFHGMALRGIAQSSVVVNEQVNFHVGP
jgi:hypothetical protein